MVGLGALNQQVCVSSAEHCRTTITGNFYSKTNQMHNISKLFYFVVALYMFRTVFPSIIRSLILYIQHQVYVKQIQLTAC